TAPNETPTIGRPIANTQIYALNQEMQPTPIRVRGELYIGGAGLAGGYSKRPGQTAERIVPHPFGEGGRRVYRTGGLWRARSDGHIEYLGRADHQVKIRGFRIELGEIEAILSDYPGLREAVALAREEDETGKRLVAYYTGEAVGAEVLRAHLSSRLPE